MRGSEQGQDLGDDGQGDGDVQLRVRVRASLHKKNENYFVTLFRENWKLETQNIRIPAFSFSFFKNGDIYVTSFSSIPYCRISAIAF